MFYLNILCCRSQQISFFFKFKLLFYNEKKANAFFKNLSVLKIIKTKKLDKHCLKKNIFLIEK